jgi:hypothetical protein
MKRILLSALAIFILGACTVQPTFNNKDNPNGVLRFEGDKLVLLPCADNQSLIWTNGAWECGKSALQTCADNQSLIWKNGAWECGDSGAAVPASCSDNNSVLYWRDNSWQCGPRWEDCNDDQSLVRRNGAWECENLPASLGALNCQTDSFATWNSSENRWRCSGDTSAVDITHQGGFSAHKVAINAQHGASILTVGGSGDFQGDLNVSGTVNQSSSRFLKKNIRPLKNPLDKIKQLNGVEYQWKKTGRKDIGVIAEEVDEVFPEIVGHDANGKATGVDYGRLSSVLIEAVKAQQVQLDAQKAQIDKQQMLIEKLLSAKTSK